MNDTEFTHIATNKSNQNDVVKVRYNQSTEEYEVNFMVQLIKNDWNIKAITDETI